jgi:3-methylcrotonyl-CoA carboxylase alpha subunit
VSRFYDTMIAKLIVWGADRPAAIARMLRALGEYHVAGVRTTIPILSRIVAHDDFRAGRISTAFLERTLSALTEEEPRHTSVAVIAAALAEYERTGHAQPTAETPAASAWRFGAQRGWRR